MAEIINFPLKAKGDFDHDGPFEVNHEYGTVSCYGCGEAVDLDEFFTFLCLHQVTLSGMVTDVKRLLGK